MGDFQWLCITSYFLCQGSYPDLDHWSWKEMMTYSPVETGQVRLNKSVGDCFNDAPLFEKPNKLVQNLAPAVINPKYVQYNCKEHAILWTVCWL
jgi:hypothetical protein